MAHFDDSPKAPSPSRSQQLLDEDLGTTSGSDGEDLETVRGPPEEVQREPVRAAAAKEPAKEVEMPPKKGKRQYKPKTTAAKKKAAGTKKPANKAASMAKQITKYRNLAAQILKI
jgi:hypothetical protein